MTSYNPPHEIRDEEKLRGMIETLENGGDLPAIVVQGYWAFTGSHRIAAWEHCDIEADVIEMSDEDYIAAMEEMRLDWEVDDVKEYNEFCEALYKVTNDEEIKSAVRDQRGY